jgi:hypothetical protein
MVTKAKRDVGIKFIEEATGLDVSEFLKRFRASSNKIKTDILKDDMYADAIRVLTLPLDDRKTAFKNILINPDKRKDRMILSGFYFKDQPTIDFAKSIKANFEKPIEYIDMKDITGSTNVGGLTTPLPKFTNDQLKQFAAFYNSENPFLLKSLRYHMGDKAFMAVQRKALSSKLIDNATGKRINTLFTSFPTPEKDAAVQRAFVVLQNYKNMVPKATGSELRLGPNNLGEFDINQLLLQDDLLSKYLIKDGKLSNFRRQQILKQLNREGLLKELGLDKFYLKGGNPKVVGTDDPKLQQFLIDLAKTSNPTLKDAQMLNVLSEPQYGIYQNMRENVKKVIGQQGTPLMREFLGPGAKNYYARVNDIINYNFGRMMKFGIREGKTVDEIFNSFQEQINDPDFYSKVVPLILKKVKLQDKISFNQKKYGLDIDDVHLAHKGAVVDNIDTTFKLSNIFIGKAKLNNAERALQNKISNLKSILQQKGGKRLFLSEEAEENIKREIKDLEFDLEHGGYYDPIEEGFEEQMDQALSQSAFGSSFVFADGGFATMEDVLGYSNE